MLGIISYVLSMTSSQRKPPGTHLQLNKGLLIHCSEGEHTMKTRETSQTEGVRGCSGIWACLQ